MLKKKGISYYYLMLFAVIVIWSFDPLVCKLFYSDFSAAVVAAIATVSSFLFFLVLLRKKLCLINASFLKVAIPIGFLNSIAGLLQRIGLQYTSPASFAFLEHLAVATVPFVMFIAVKRKPRPIQLLSVSLCLVGCFILSGMTLNGFKGNIGDVLCALSGIIYGVCVALIGIYSKRIDSSLYILIFTFIYSITSVASVFLLSSIKINGIPIEEARFTPDIKLLIPVAAFGLLTVGVTWLMKTAAIKRLDPTFVAIVSPFTAVISGILSVLTKTDKLTSNLIIGAALIMAAAIIPEIFDAVLLKSIRRTDLRDI